MNFEVKSNKYIVLKEKNNKGLIIGIIVSILVITLFATSKMWLADGRNVVKKNIDTELLFAMNEVKLDNNYYWDKEKSVGEIKFFETRSADKGKYDVTYKVFTDKNVELPLEVIRGNQVAVKDSIRIDQNVLLQFRLPKDFYYIKVEISQKDNVKQEIMLDYRMFENKNVNEKGKDYLLNYEVETDKLNKLKEPVKTIDKRLKEIKDNLDKEKDETKKAPLVNEQKTLNEQKEKHLEEIKKQEVVIKGMQ
ncbi:MAG: hypothetical protein RR623_08025 [Bacilli bacterium]